MPYSLLPWGKAYEDYRGNAVFRITYAVQASCPFCMAYAKCIQKNAQKVEQLKPDHVLIAHYQLYL